MDNLYSKNLKPFPSPDLSLSPINFRVNYILPSYRQLRILVQRNCSLSSKLVGMTLALDVMIPQIESLSSKPVNNSCTQYLTFISIYILILSLFSLHIVLISTLELKDGEMEAGDIKEVECWEDETLRGKAPLA